MITRRDLLPMGALARCVHDGLRAQPRVPRIGLPATGSPVPRIPLTVNLRTARTLGVALPQPIMQRADRIIE